MKRKAGLIGWPVDHSLSPMIHNHWLKQHMLEGEYKKIAIKPEDLAKIKDVIEEKKLCGFNVTIPHKTNIISYLDECDDIAKEIGAVNTVIRSEGKWVGCNTDCYGFGQHLISSYPQISGKKALVLGAGGATRAAIKALKQLGYSYITVCNRTSKKAEILAEKFGVGFAEWEEKENYLKDIDLLVNTTSLGMNGFPELSIDLKELERDAIVYDIVYTPQETRLIKQARAQGNKTIGGLGMLLHQAIPAFSAWYGTMPKIDESLKEKLAASL